MSLLETLLAFIFTILLIVSIHEYGHFLCMRLFGIRVLKFSIGFGPRLLHWRSAKSGTDYVIAALPFGGFVKPYDSRAEKRQKGNAETQEIAPLSGDFSAKPAWQRFITYAAGPAANFVLAMVLYWLIAVYGQLGLVSNIGKVAPGSTAAAAGLQAGDKVVAVNGDKVRTWQEVTNLLLGQVGISKPVDVTIERQGEKHHASLSLGSWATNPQSPPLGVLGISPQAPGARLGKVLEDSAAAAAGFRKGDRIKSVNGATIDSWAAWVKAVQSHPDETITVKVGRDGKTQKLQLTPEPVERNGKTIGRAGVMIGGLTKIQYGPLAAIPAAWQHLKQETGMIVGAMLRLFEGHLSVKTLGGPITIAEAAGQTANVGLAVFLGFLAFFSISLGVLNLLPVPLLDGGWMVFCLIEMVVRRPVPERFLEVAQGVGLSLVVLLMVVATYNDVIRQFG